MNNNTFVHKYIKPLLDKSKVSVDMTLGNGNDAYMLAQKCKHVYGFDIALEAIEKSKERLKEFDNVTLINDSHINVDKYVNDDVFLFIFNLGYLPHSDVISTTKASDSLIAFKKAYELLHDKGYIVITFYLGHQGGKDEYYLLDSYIHKNRIPIMESYRQDKTDSPITYIIRKD